MSIRGVAVLALCVAMVSVSSRTDAQARITVAAGASIPTGDYGEYAKTGYIGTAGVMFNVGEKGLSVGGVGVFGSNSHSDIDGDKTNLIGVLGSVSYRLGDAEKTGVFVLGNVGFLQHSYKSDMFPSEEGSSSGVAFGGGAGVHMPMGTKSLYVMARFITASIENETTSFIPVQVGVSFPIGGK